MITEIDYNSHFKAFVISQKETLGTLALTKNSAGLGVGASYKVFGV